MANIVARHEFTPRTMSCIKMSYTGKARMDCYYYASAPKRVLRRSQKYMKGFAELINPDGKCDGYFDDTAIFGQEY